MKYILLILLFVTTFSFSQKREYVFDYIIKYEITFHNQNFTQANYYLTNSKDNSYFGIIHQTDSLQFELTFRHHDEAFAKVKLLKSDFYRVEYINIACENVLFSKNIYKYQTKNYDFHILKDTRLL